MIVFVCVKGAIHIHYSSVREKSSSNCVEQTDGFSLGISYHEREQRGEETGQKKKCTNHNL